MSKVVSRLERRVVAIFLLATDTAQVARPGGISAQYFNALNHKVGQQLLFTSDLGLAGGCPLSDGRPAGAIGEEAIRKGLR